MGRLLVAESRRTGGVFAKGDQVFRNYLTGFATGSYTILGRDETTPGFHQDFPDLIFLVESVRRRKEPLCYA
jgi:hypothetical protein